MDIKAYIEEVCKNSLEFLGGKKNTTKTIVTHGDFCKYDGLYLRKALLGIKLNQNAQITSITEPTLQT